METRVFWEEGIKEDKGPGSKHLITSPAQLILSFFLSPSKAGVTVITAKGNHGPDKCCVVKEWRENCSKDWALASGRRRPVPGHQEFSQTAAAWRLPSSSPPLLLPSLPSPPFPPHAPTPMPLFLLERFLVVAGGGFCFLLFCFVF